MRAVCFLVLAPAVLAVLEGEPGWEKGEWRNPWRAHDFHAVVDGQLVEACVLVESAYAIVAY
jgi:hypothetical protein